MELCRVPIKALASNGEPEDDTLKGFSVYVNDPFDNSRMLVITHLELAETILVEELSHYNDIENTLFEGEDSELDRITILGETLRSVMDRAKVMEVELFPSDKQEKHE